jgi:hypothetical protein
MKTPRELILERHQSAEAKLKAIRAEDLAACTRSAGQVTRERLFAFDLMSAVRRIWQETFWPWRRAWIGMAAIWVCILGFSMGIRETPRIASTKPPQPDAVAVALLQEQKQLLTQLLGPGEPPLVSHIRMPGSRSAVEPSVGRDEEAGRLETIPCAEAIAQA